MPPVEHLERLMGDLESDRVERKASLSHPERIRQAVCACANDLPGHGAPGYVFVGVDDTGRPTSLAITDQLMLSLADMRSDGNILPLPSLTVEKITLQGVPVAVMEVYPSNAPPVRFKGQVWIRIGPRRAIATLEEERRLAERQVAGARAFDRKSCLGATLQDLLLGPFQTDYLPSVVDRQVLAENRRSVEEQLASLRFFDRAQRAPTHAGILLFGKDPLQFLAGAYIQFVRFDGEDLADPVLDQKQITSNLMTQLLQLDQLLPLQVRTAHAAARGLRHEDRPDYPLAAIREFSLNALMHRTYEGANAPIRIYWFSNRVEIQSPGGLYGQVTPHNYERVNDYRNPTIAEAMKNLGYVERFGTGITRAKAALVANGNAPATFHFEETHVLVTVRRKT